ncbi:MAG: CPBP family intramembrane metalloprotease [Chloroflexi bacterium]|nr:CPBP family intramembrane metalloprotease [Chloroflexota bacterium]
MPALVWGKPSVIALIGSLIVAISVTEWIFAYRSAAYGIILSLFLTVAIYLVVVLGGLKSPYLECVESMVLIPLYILFTSSLPWFFLQQNLLLPAVYSLILALCFWHIYEKNISLTGMGFHWKKWGKYTLWGILLGMPLGSIEYLILRPAPSALSFQVSYLLRDLFYMLFFVGLAEELLFRGLIQTDLKRAFGWRWSLFLQSFLFMVMHLTWRSVPELFFVFGAAVVLGVMYEKTKSMVGIIVLHGVGNTFLVGIMPYVLKLSS